MSIKTTVYITREHAITRLQSIYTAATHQNYKAIQEMSYDPEHSVQTFVDIVIDMNFSNIAYWTDDMLEEMMDKPFFRHSMFDNYIIANKENKQDDQKTNPLL